MSKQKKGLCIYCLKHGAITREHVIARMFWGDIPLPSHPRPPVSPACQSCNERMRKNQEHYLVRSIWTVDEANKCAESARIKLIHSLVTSSTAHQRRGFRQEITNSMRSVNVHDGFLYCGPGMALSVEHARVRRMFADMARGMYFHEYNRVLPLNMPYTVFVDYARDPFDLKHITLKEKVGNHFAELVKWGRHQQYGVCHWVRTFYTLADDVSTLSYIFMLYNRRTALVSIPIDRDAAYLPLIEWKEKL